MYLVFTLRNNDGTLAKGESPSVEVYLDGELDNTIVPVITPLVDGNSEYTGDYELSMDEPEEVYNYIRFHISCTGCIPKRLTVYPDTTAQTVIAALPDISSLSTFDPTTDTVTINSEQAATMVTATGFATQADLSGLSTFNPATDTVTINAEQAATMVTADVSGLATSADIPTSSDIASAVLTTNVAPLTVDTKEYTIKHLIMATQRSYVTEGESPHWVICAGDVDSQGNLKDITQDTIIAKRTLKLNGNGAIVKTE